MLSKLPNVSKASLYFVFFWLRWVSQHHTRLSLLQCIDEDDKHGSMDRGGKHLHRNSISHKRDALGHFFRWLGIRKSFQVFDLWFCWLSCQPLQPHLLSSHHFPSYVFGVQNQLFNTSFVLALIRWFCNPSLNSRCFCQLASRAWGPGNPIPLPPSASWPY